MQILPADSTPDDAPLLALGILEDGPTPPMAPASTLIAALRESGDIKGSVGEVVPLHGAMPSGGSLWVFGLGKAEKFDVGAAFAAAVCLSKKLAAKPRKTLAVIAPGGGAAVVSALVEGLVIGTEGPGLRKTEPSRHPFESLTIVRPSGLDAPAHHGALRRGEIVGRCVNLARELVNTPPSEKPPAVLAERAADLARADGLEVEIWDRDRLSAERFGGVLAVSAGSGHDPRFVRIAYRGAGDVAPVALVGKGVTFDSGGLSIKPSASMEDMKCDMAGMAAVLAATLAAARLGLRINIDGYFALVENMTGGLAMKLGDVLSMRGGPTVEVLNTDAEGRLVLADVLSYAVERKPSAIVDLATLTGACMVALGTKVAGLFANDERLAAQIGSACAASGERAWRMPLDDDYGDAIKSKVAEIKNVGGKWGGSITAAKFLQRFVGDSPWAHLDIAGPAWADDESSVRDAGGTGAFTRTLVAWLEARSSAG